MSAEGRHKPVEDSTERSPAASLESDCVPLLSGLRSRFIALHHDCGCDIARLHLARDEIDTWSPTVFCLPFFFEPRNQAVPIRLINAAADVLHKPRLVPPALLQHVSCQKVRCQMFKQSRSLHKKDITCHVAQL